MNALEERQNILKEILKPAFKAAGFKTSGNKFMKAEDGFIKAFSMENDSWNTSDYASFTYFVGISFPVIDTLRDRKQPKFFSAMFCPYSCVLNRLSKSHRMCVIDVNTDIREFRQCVTDSMNDYVFPFFDQFSKVEDCLKLETIFEGNRSGIYTDVGLTLLSMGNTEQGNQLIDTGLKFLDEQPNEYTESSKKRMNDYRNLILSKNKLS